MKVLFVIRENAKRILGGDLVQLLNTKKELEKFDEVTQFEICYGVDRLEDIVNNFDVVHVFNLQTPLTTLNAVRIAKKPHKKVVVSTIYYNIRDMVVGLILSKLNFVSLYRFETFRDILYSFYRKVTFPPFVIVQAKRNKFADSILNPKILDIINEIIEEADLLLPNSDTEIYQLCNVAKGKTRGNIKAKSRIIVNGVDAERFLNPEKFYNANVDAIFGEIRTKYKRIVGEVARIEEIKNQVSIVEALRDRDDIAIIFVGSYREEDSYFKKLKKLSIKRGGVYFLGQLKTDYIPYVLKNLDVHVLPSLRETPGLASLESAAAGTPIVSTKYAPNSLYFKDYAFICDPFDLKDLYNKIVLAYNMDKGKREEMRKYILENFTWGIAARETLRAYKEILSNG